MANVVAVGCGSEEKALANVDVLIFEAMREQAALRSSRLMSLVKDRYVKRREAPTPCDTTWDD